MHIVQFGFRPGAVGDRFAEALLAKARDGVPVRMVVDRNGTDPERGSKEFYDRLAAGGVQACMASGTQARGPFGPLGDDGRPVRWKLRTLGHIDHRKVLVIDGRIGWVGGAGVEDHFEDGRFHDLFLRLEGPVVSQLQLVVLASLRSLGGTAPVEELPQPLPGARRRARARRRSCSTTRPGASGRSPTRSRSCSSRRARRSTSSTRT